MTDSPVKHTQKLLWGPKAVTGQGLSLRSSEFLSGHYAFNFNFMQIIFDLSLTSFFLARTFFLLLFQSILLSKFHFFLQKNAFIYLFAYKQCIYVYISGFLHLFLSIHLVK